MKEKDNQLGILKEVVEELMQWKATTEVGKENGRVNLELTNNVRITCRLFNFLCMPSLKIEILKAQCQYEHDCIVVDV